jgi:hypothetical protein
MVATPHKKLLVQALPCIDKMERPFFCGSPQKHSCKKKKMLEMEICRILPNIGPRFECVPFQKPKP